MKEAMLYEKIEDRKVRCNLCNHRCIILPSKRGICGVRENQEGALYTLVYEKVVAANIDPIEKNHFSIFTPEQGLIPLQQQAVISDAFTAKIITSLKCQRITMG